MSEQEQTPATALGEKPQSVLDFEKTLQEVHGHMETAKSAQYPGTKIKAANGLFEFLNNVFQQVLDQYKKDPWVVAVQKQIEAEQAKKEAEAAAQAANAAAATKAPQLKIAEPEADAGLGSAPSA
jgi:hypothetical protein